LLALIAGFGVMLMMLRTQAQAQKMPRGMQIIDPEI
jgi:hypothetical protein